jgi:hypothetical protein
MTNGPAETGVEGWRTDIYPYGYLLENVKREFMDMSTQQGNVEDLGKLAQETGAHQWTGKISLDERLKSGEVSTQEIDQAIRDINDYFIPTTLGAHVRCIDGRNYAGYDDNDPDSYGRSRGPQIPGGTPGGALAWRLASGNDGKTPMGDANLRDDIALFAEVDVDTGYTADGHTDEKATKGRTGCGAVDGMEEILAMFNPDSIKDIEHITKLILGENNYKPSNFDKIIASAVRLLSNKEQYFTEKEEVLEEIKTHTPGGVPVLVGPHNEVLTVINLVPNTTLHKEHFNSRTSGKIGVFNYDFWRTKDVSEHLASDEEEMRSRYLHARVSTAVGALMYLTDGSQRLLIRTPSSQEDIAA